MLGSIRGTVTLAVVVVGIMLIPGAAFADPPANDNFADAQVLDSALPTSANGTTVDSTVEVEESMPSAPLAGSVWFRWTAPASFARSLRIDICGLLEPDEGFYGVNVVYQGSILAELEVIVSRSGGCRNIIFVPTPGVEYSIQVGNETGYPAEQKPFTIGLTAVDPPPNDKLADALPVFGPLPKTVSGTNANAGIETDDEWDFFDYGYTVWYQIAVVQGGSLSIDACGSGYQPSAHLFDPLGAEPVFSFDELDHDHEDVQGCNVEVGDRTTQEVEGGREYWIGVDTWNDFFEYDSGPFTLAFSGTAKLSLAASNALKVTKIKANKKNGTAKATVKLPGAGILQLVGSKKVKAVKKTVASAKTVTLKVKVKGKLAKQLKKKGKAKASLKFRFSPSGPGGTPKTVTKKVKLKRN